MRKHTVTHLPLPMLLGNEIHLLDYPAWVFNEQTLTVVDANKAARNYCMYNEHEIIGLSILELWHDEDLLHILNDLVVEHYEHSFFGKLRHKKKNGEMEVIRVRATRIPHSISKWAVHLVGKYTETKSVNNASYS